MDKVVLFLSERLGISQAGILLVALLAGADYDKVNFSRHLFSLQNTP